MNKGRMKWRHVKSPFVKLVELAPKQDQRPGRLRKNWIATQARRTRKMKFKQRSSLLSFLIMLLCLSLCLVVADLPFFSKLQESAVDNRCRLAMACFRTSRPAASNRTLMTSAFASALSHRLVVLALAIAATTRLFAAVMHRVDGCPRAPLGFLLRNSALLIAFLDVSGLSFLFVRIFVFVASWHFVSSFFDCG